MNQEQQDLEKVKTACRVLIEHFDSVQIFATRHEPTDGGTINLSWGAGNWFARRGQVAEWLVKETEITKRDVREEE